MRQRYANRGRTARNLRMLAVSKRAYGKVQRGSVEPGVSSPVLINYATEGSGFEILAMPLALRGQHGQSGCEQSR